MAEEPNSSGDDADERDAAEEDTGWKPVLQPFDPAAEFEVRCRNLPHWRQQGATYFVTFRLADSLPQEKLRGLRAERLEWARRQPPPVSQADLRRFQALFSVKIEQYLNAGYGACWLKRPPVAGLVGISLPLVSWLMLLSWDRLGEALRSLVGGWPAIIIVWVGPVLLSSVGVWVSVVGCRKKRNGFAIAGLAIGIPTLVAASFFLLVMLFMAFLWSGAR